MLLADELWPTHVSLAALYLRGAPRSVEVPRRRWVQVEDVLRRSVCPLEGVAATLREAGFVEEAVTLDAPGLLAWSEARGERFATPVCRGYPQTWRDRLGDGAPAALWRRGDLPEGPVIGVVGSRDVETAEIAFAESVGQEAVRAGFAVVSGGAAGCDTFGAQGARRANGSVLRILPCGLDHRWADGEGDLAMAPPNEPFSTALAMERNALIYAAAEATVVVHARYRQGGTWHGAADALRRRLATVLVRETPSDRAFRALIALGARPLASPASLVDALETPALQLSMFAAPRR